MPLYRLRKCERLFGHLPELTAGWEVGAMEFQGGLEIRFGGDFQGFGDDLPLIGLEHLDLL
jgi:hypothetical protein